jgi:hypothetical protein
MRFPDVNKSKVVLENVNCPRHGCLFLICVDPRIIVRFVFVDRAIGTIMEPATIIFNTGNGSIPRAIHIKSLMKCDFFDRAKHRCDPALKVVLWSFTTTFEVLLVKIEGTFLPANIYVRNTERVV